MDTKLFKVVLKALWSASDDAILVVGTDGKIIGANAQILALLGWNPDQLAGQSVETLIPTGKRGVHRIHRRYFAKNPTPRRMGNDSVLCALAKDGRQIPVDISLSAVELDGELFTVAVVRNAIARQAHERDLKQQALRDPLTQVYNRYYFDEEIDRVQRSGTWPIAMLVVNIDDLPSINEEHGHEAGDLVIKRGAGVIKTATRDHDIVARLGGDKFVVLLEDVDEDELAEFVDRIQALCLEDSGVASLKMTIGGAVGSDQGDIRALIRSADARMYALRDGD